MPEPMRRDASGGPDVCALGRQYGGWRPGSQEAAICEKTYGSRTGRRAYGHRS
ncbi:hypothetical protein ACFXAE_34575 [Streptomyces sp. NPDC059454]|uniref:hypothetical protein n=1 Tax=Streptomyces sp. NPDC059454 TaxID=3346836 RepID=UPI00369E088E